MLKGFCMFLATTVLVVGAQSLSAQVYRCETASGVVYADFPCSEEAEEIEIDVVEPATPMPEEVSLTDENGGLAAINAEDVTNAAEPAAIDTATQAPAEVTTLSDFSRMLVSQRESQINEIDERITGLREQIDSEDFRQSDATTQAQHMLEISSLEAERQSILDQYETLIAEAESRAE